MSTKSFSIGDIVSESWDIIKKNIWIFAGTILGFYLIIFLIMSLTGAVGAIGTNAMTDVSDVFAAIFGVSFILAMLLIIIVASYFCLGYYKMALTAADRLEPNLSAFSVSLKKILNSLFASLIFVIAVYIGTILCIIPGIIIAVRLQLFYFFIIDKDCSAFEALSRSWDATKGETLNLVLLYLAFYLVNLVGVLCCGIGLLVTGPMTIIGYALVYRRLTGEIPQDVDFEALSEPDNI